MFVQIPETDLVSPLYRDGEEVRKGTLVVPRLISFVPSRVSNGCS